MKKSWEWSIARELAALATHGQDDNPRMTIVVMPAPVPEMSVTVSAPAVTVESVAPPKAPRQIRVKERDSMGRIVSAEII